MAQITKIEAQKNNRHRFNLYIDGEFFLGISEQTLIDYGFFENKELSSEDLKKLKAKEDFNFNFNRALNYLNRSMRTESEMRIYMEKKDIDPDIIDRIIDRLKEVKMLDDEFYAKVFIEEKQTANRYGAKKIEFLLKQKGVASEIIYSQLKNINSDLDYENCLNLAKQRLQRIDDEDIYKIKNKLYNYLAGRGFSYDLIKDVFGELNLG